MKWAMRPDTAAPSASSVPATLWTRSRSAPLLTPANSGLSPVFDTSHHVNQAPPNYEFRTSVLGLSRPSELQLARLERSMRVLFAGFRAGFRDPAGPKT